MRDIPQRKLLSAWVFEIHLLFSIYKDGVRAFWGLFPPKMPIPQSPFNSVSMHDQDACEVMGNIVCKFL